MFYIFLKLLIWIGTETQTRDQTRHAERKDEVKSQKRSRNPTSCKQEEAEKPPQEVVLLQPREDAAMQARICGFYEATWRGKSRNCAAIPPSHAVTQLDLHWPAAQKANLVWRQRVQEPPADTQTDRWGGGGASEASARREFYQNSNYLHYNFKMIVCFWLKDSPSYVWLQRLESKWGKKLLNSFRNVFLQLRWGFVHILVSGEN